MNTDTEMGMGMVNAGSSKESYHDMKGRSVDCIRKWPHGATESTVDWGSEGWLEGPVALSQLCTQFMGGLG